jgi:hydroxypyruvate reductase
VISSGQPISRPACVISGGETTVTIHGTGKGGRNQEFALACGIEIAGLKGAAVFSAGTDGTDGPTDAAGAYADWKMVDRAKKLGLDPYRYLDNNDSFRFFEQLNDLIITGPTKTNVMDLRLLLIR